MPPRAGRARAARRRRPARSRRGTISARRRDLGDARGERVVQRRRAGEVDAACDDELERAVEHVQPAGHAEHLVGQRASLLRQQRPRDPVAARGDVEHERRELGAGREPAPRDRLEEVVEIAHAERGAESRRERRVRTRRLAHARARPDRPLDDSLGAAELAEAERHRPRRLARLVATGGDRPRAGRGDAAGRSGDAGAQRGEGVVRDETLPAQLAALLESAVEQRSIARPVDARERERGGGDLAALPLRLLERLADRRAIALSALEPDVSQFEAPARPLPSTRPARSERPRPSWSLHHRPRSRGSSRAGSVRGRPAGAGCALGARRDEPSGTPCVCHLAALTSLDPSDLSIFEIHWVGVERRSRCGLLSCEVGHSLRGANWHSPRSIAESSDGAGSGGAYPAGVTATEASPR